MAKTRHSGGQGRPHSSRRTSPKHRRPNSQKSAGPAAAPFPQGPGEPIGVQSGVLELDNQGAGFLRSQERNLAVRPDDPYVSPDAIRRFCLRGGECITGQIARVENKGNRRSKVSRIDAIDGVPAGEWQPPTPLNETTAVDPTESLHFDTPGGPVTMRVVDLFTPIGRGQRGLIVAPPRTGKTILLQQMAHGIAENHPEVYMIVLLVDERPEEVTEMRRNVRGEVIASSNDENIASHVRIARLVNERARRLAEQGRHIIILLDSITRLARAFNSNIGTSGRTMTGGLDIRALQEPKQIFGSARNIEGGGSLTIIASALIETGSRADDFIFQEFKGTGNMELVLNRELANLRIWPAMDLNQSGTRKEEKLLAPDTLRKVYLLRRQLNDLPLAKQMTTLLDWMGRFNTQAEFLANLRS
ncbi:MAG: transcription termination factor Rho [Phycisphaerales bacterium]|nr:transcription termination factor Rho [Phycisphaerales bacterium]